MEAIFMPVEKSFVVFTGLHELTSRLINTFLDRASQNNSFFVNEIPHDILLEVNPDFFTAVLGGVLSTVADFARESCIRLAAQIYGSVILIRVKGFNLFCQDSLDQEIQKLQPIAEVMKGSVGVTSLRNKVTTITFGFPNCN
jgi:hypothetical protein